MENNNNVKIFASIVGILILGTIAAVIINSSSNNKPIPPGKYDTFAQCLKDKGAIFYGAFWCPHCQAQKKEFGTSVKYLPYVECSTPDASGQTQICKDKNISSYPTWILADGTRVPDDSPVGAGVKLETLAAKTGCTLPQ